MYEHEQNDYPTVTERLREYARQMPELHLTSADQIFGREIFAEGAFGALYDLLAACDAAPGIPTKAALTVAQIRNLIRENIRKAS